MNRVPLRPDYSAARRHSSHSMYRALTALALSGRGTGRHVDDVLKAWPHDDVPALVIRAASNPATVGTSAWAGSLAPSAVADLVVGLAPMSAGAALVAHGMRVSLEGHQAITIPNILTVATDAGTWVSE